MRTAALVLLTAALVSGCRGDAAPTKPEEVAGRWVKAMNAHDWHLACELSVQSEDGPMSCADLLETAFTSGDVDMELEGVYMSGDKGSFSTSRPPDGLSDLGLERQAGRWRVHFEVQIIR